MIKVAKVVNRVLEVVRLTRKMEASEKKLCEVEKAKYDRCTVQTSESTRGGSGRRTASVR